jgi:hypothetical protein
MFSADVFLVECDFPPKNGPVPSQPMNGYIKSKMIRSELLPAVIIIRMKAVFGSDDAIILARAAALNPHPSPAVVDDHPLSNTH